MKIKHLYQILFSLLLILSGVSCNSNDTESVSTTASSDAQIYTISFTAIPRTSIDTVAYAALGSTKFTINQATGRIYNVTPLPYGTELKNFLPAITFTGGSTSLGLEVIYTSPKDSTVTWSTTDSIDFAQKLVLRTTAADGATRKEYYIEFRRYAENPDSIVWTQQSSLPTLGSSKSLIKDDIIYTYIANGNSVTLAKSSGSTWTSSATNGLPSDIVTESFIYGNNMFLSIGKNGDTYISENGIDWSKSSSGKNITSIYGAFPLKTGETDSYVLVAVGGTKFAKTKDFASFIDVTDIDGYTSNSIPSGFPLSEYSVITSSNNLLIVGGKGADSKQLTSTWIVNATETDTDLQITTNSNRVPFDANKGICAFNYNNTLFALANNQLYTLPAVGSFWTPAPSSQALDTRIANLKNRSVLVDSKNNIWLIGGVNESAVASDKVWTGKMNIFKEGIIIK